MINLPNRNWIFPDHWIWQIRRMARAVVVLRCSVWQDGGAWGPCQKYTSPRHSITLDKSFSQFSLLQYTVLCRRFCRALFGRQTTTRPSATADLLLNHPPSLPSTGRAVTSERQAIIKCNPVYGSEKWISQTQQHVFQLKHLFLCPFAIPSHQMQAGRQLTKSSPPDILWEIVKRKVRG